MYPSFRRLSTHFIAKPPGAKIEFKHLMMVDGGYEHGLESGFLDLVIGNWRTPPEHLHLQPLCKDELVCLMRAGYPIKPGRLTQAVYQEAGLPHEGPHK
jgi:DNA-binding transcriptional LysR family regulator